MQPYGNLQYMKKQTKYLSKCFMYKVHTSRDQNSCNLHISASAYKTGFHLQQ